ncbi:tRNA (adenosine(37)-N6)-threonylcarbamoyltransferase complex ATPase subunit type 1 TsaE [Agreia sp. COWG]|uniref:tRNA (adenosine(37)-N6)-threonylcarbamoyltransferase complex ATPase subunit type 1 TsaE n=1 Tax=Agreia sp. COWG TaxID=2773266 RepID=UPI00192902B2|nr:tRNA (adenosine(37)-N6)-threonylcarbamoyltransferase complex ATPase subunit type 1 TsaE [Agreia sp. COWG]CAD6004292.1 tRNA threonylcarbamoyladenosine biosynthesis protein TsaE [Agreia sp. COWG]
MKALPREFVVATPDEMVLFAERVAELLSAGDVVLLTGELGAGKTTFTRGLGRALGVRGAVTSPTFVLARTHPRLDSAEPPLVHVDAYRLASAVELDDLDIDFARSIVVIEWGAGMVEELTDSWLSITIDRPRGAGDDADDAGADDEEPIEPRRVTVDGVGPRWS